MRLYTISESGWASVNSSAWIGLVGALGGVTLTGLIGLLTAMLNHRLLAAAAERDRKFRTTDRLYDLRIEAYVQYLHIAETMNDGHKAFTRTRSPEQRYEEFEREEWTDFAKVRLEYQAAWRKAQLLATEDVRKALKDFDKWLQETCRRMMDTGEWLGGWTNKEDELLEAMRVEQTHLPGAQGERPPTSRPRGGSA